MNDFREWMRARRERIKTKANATFSEDDLARLRAEAAMPGSLLGQSEVMCQNPDCRWHGLLSDTIPNGKTIVGSCPKCHGWVTRYDPSVTFEEFKINPLTKEN